LLHVTRRGVSDSVGAQKYLLTTAGFSMHAEPVQEHSAGPMPVHAFLHVDEAQS